MYKNELLLVQQARNLAKSKRKIFKKKAAEYYSQNKETIKEKSRERYKNFLQEEEDKMKEPQRKNIKKRFSMKKKL